MDNSNQFPGLLLSSGQAQWQSGHLSASLCGREWGHGGHRLIMDVIIWSDPRTPRDYGPAVTSDYLLCVVSLHCINVLSDSEEQVFDWTWCVAILTIRHIWAGPLIIVSSQLLTYLSSGHLILIQTQSQWYHISLLWHRSVLSSSYVLETWWWSFELCGGN